MKRQRYGLTLLVLAVVGLSYALLQTMVMPALPDDPARVRRLADRVTWLLTAFLLTASVATPLLGRLGDMYGKERVLLVVLGVFAVGSLVSAIARLDRRADPGRADPGRRRRDLPARLRDHPRRVPARAGGRLDRPDLGHLRHRRRRSASCWPA